MTDSKKLSWKVKCCKQTQQLLDNEI